MNDALIAMFDKDVKVYDVYYIEARVREILDKLLTEMVYQNKEIAKLRQSFFEKNIKKAQKVKYELKKTKDKLADERNERCEPVCQEIVRKLLDLELLQSDQQFFDEALSQDDELIAKNRVRGFTDGLFAGLQHSINQSLMRAAKVVWGSEKEDIRMKYLDKILKQK